MAKESLDKLGFDEEAAIVLAARQKQAPGEPGKKVRKQMEGFVAGLETKPVKEVKN